MSLNVKGYNFDDSGTMFYVVGCRGGGFLGKGSEVNVPLDKAYLFTSLAEVNAYISTGEFIVTHFDKIIATWVIMDMAKGLIFSNFPELGEYLYIKRGKYGEEFEE